MRISDFGIKNAFYSLKVGLSVFWLAVKTSLLLHRLLSLPCIKLKTTIRIQKEKNMSQFIKFLNQADMQPTISIEKRVLKQLAGSSSLKIALIVFCLIGYLL